MGISDHEYVNFSEDYELNYHLDKVDKRQTKGNREILKDMGAELKKVLDKTMLTHAEFHPYVSKQKYRLE
ncbi:hypothetical protein [Thalassospira sp.]|uniref:hypothetical protein n=1 Tax=unclassified Thalassospira TaxID=2648997 RepID=UPI000C439932|nr:hypothetical protein [Thalassospira sp.]MAL39561.1 hypothetical protein [Thalassospira sp.]|tara:strand:+ start:1699 stop:1908 length:210 start_codon:yes stop_codon:yes gene_type:complete